MEQSRKYLFLCNYLFYVKIRLGENFIVLMDFLIGSLTIAFIFMYIIFVSILGYSQLVFILYAPFFYPLYLYALYCFRAGVLVSQKKVKGINSNFRLITLYPFMACVIYYDIFGLVWAMCWVIQCFYEFLLPGLLYVIFMVYFHKMRMNTHAKADV